MPADAPTVARRVFEACTATDPAARPTAAQVVQWLQEDEASRQAAAASGGGGSSSALGLVQ
jgi:hypothetical protein